MRIKNITERIEREENDKKRTKEFAESLDVPKEIRQYVEPLTEYHAKIKVPFLKEEIFVSGNTFWEEKREITYRYGSKMKPAGGHNNYTFGAKYEAPTFEKLMKQIISEKEIEVKQ